MRASNEASGFHVPAGTDRFDENALQIWGLIPLASKVSAQDTGGTWYIFEHRDMPKGGPPRHIHFGQDEWFYALQGEFVMVIGERRFQLRPGDSAWAPRMIPHVWACVSDTPGTLLTAVSPAGTFEEFIREAGHLSTLPSPEEVAQAFERHGMKVVGPPLDVTAER